MMGCLRPHGTACRHLRAIPVRDTGPRERVFLLDSMAIYLHCSFVSVRVVRRSSGCLPSHRPVACRVKNRWLQGCMSPSSLVNRRRMLIMWNYYT